MGRVRRRTTEDVCYVSGDVKREKERFFPAVTQVSTTKALETNISWAKESCIGTNPGAAALPRHMNHISMGL